MEQYDEKAWYKFTDKDGNVHYSRGDNGYIWQAYTEGIPLSVNDKGEWYTEPYLEVTPSGFVSHIPDWFKDTKEYSRWMNEFVPQLTAEGPSITTDRFYQYKDMLSSLGSMGGTRQAYRKFIQDNYNVTDKGLQDAYVDTMYAVQLEGKDKEKAQISGIFGSDQVESAEEIARSFKNLSKEKLAEITTKLYWNMDKAKSGSTNLSQKEIADAVTTMGILSYIDENYKEFGDGEEFKGLLEASEWQKFARQLKSFQQTWAESGIWGIGARFMYGIGEVAAGRDFSLRIEDDRERSYLSPAFGGSLKGLEASDRIGNIAGMAASFATQIIISKGAGYLFNGKIMPMLNLGEKWSQVGTFLQTVPGAMTSDFILNDVPIDGLFAVTDLMKYGGDWGKVWENPEEQQNLIPIPGIGEFGPKVPAGLKYNLLGDVIVDLALPVVNIVFGNFHNKLDLLSNGGLTRVEDKIALKNLELQQKLTDLPVVGTGWKKFVNFMMGEADAEKVRLARKAAIAEGSLEPYREVHNLLTLNNHEGAEVVNPMLKKLDKEYKISESVQDFIKNKNQYGGIGETKVDWKDVEPGTIRKGFKGYDDVLPRDVKQGLLDIERLSELKGEALADGGIFSNPARGTEIEKLENKVKKLPKKIREFADRFSNYNKAMDQLRVELGLTTQQWEDALQADPRWEKYMTRQALVPGGGGPGTGTDPTQAKIITKGRKGYYAENYLDPYIAVNMKGVALGRAYAWNEMKKALYSYEAALGNVVAGKGGASTAAKLAEKRAEIKAKEELKKAVGYDNTIGSFSTDMSAISGSFRRISELLDKPGEISLKSVYGATQNPQIKAVVNDFNNGKITFAPGVKEAAGLTDSVAADIIQNTYAYNKVNPVKAEAPEVKENPAIPRDSADVWNDRMSTQGADMNIPDNLSKDMAAKVEAQAQQIGYNAGMSVDGVPYKYEIENGQITKMEKITDIDGLAESVRGVTGTYDISTKTVESLGEQNVYAINRALIKYRDNIPVIAEKAVFKVGYDEGALGWCPKVPTTLHVENGKLVADEFEVFLSSNYYAKGKEESTYQYQKSKAGNFHPKNSGDLSSTPIHENGHSTSGRLTISILNQRLEEGNLDINRLQNMSSYELKWFFVEERDKIQADILKTAAEKIGVKPTPANINTQRKTISGYANYDRELARRNSETIAEAFSDYFFNGADSSPFSQAIVGQFKERMNRFTVAAAPGEVFKKNGLTAKGLFKDDEYAFPKTVKTDAQKAKWLDQWRQKNPYLKGELTEETYRQANLWDTFFQKEIAAYDAKTKSVAPDLLIEKNANFLENLSKNSAKMLVQEIKQASIEGFDEALATMALSKKSTDIADAMDEFIINRVEKAANEIASKMPGGATEENLNTARITLWSEDSLRNDVVNMVYTMVPNGELAAVQEKIGKLFKTQAEGYASFEALPVDVRKLYGEEKRLQEQLARDNKYALQKGKEEDAGLKEQGYRNGSKVVSFRDGGETVYVVLNDPLEASLFERPNNYKETNVFWESVAQMSNFLARTYRLGTTGMNPVALVRNILRDPLQATLTAGFSPLSMHLSPDVFFHTLRGYGLDDATISEVSEKIKNWAGSSTLTQEIRNFSGTRVGSTGYRSKAEKYIKKFNQGATENKIVKLGEKPLEMWESMFRTQVGQQSFMRNYQRTRDVNKALGAALFDTSNATTNFSHSVAHLRRATSTIPYLTSAINGSTSFWRLFNMNPVRMITRLTAGFMVPAMAITAWNLSDKEKRQAYLNLPEWFRQGHIVLLDNENNVFALPIPEEIDQFYNVARKYIEFTQESTPFALPTIMAQGVFGFLPLDVDGFFGDDGSIQVGRGVAQLANGIMPQAATAIYELAAKENLFTGQDISDYDGWNTFLNTSSNILGTGWKQVINSIGLMCGVPESRLVGKSVENTLARDLFGIGFDDATTQFMRLVGHPSEVDPDTGKETKATGLFAESEDLAKKIEKIEDDIIFASEDQKAELEKKKQDLINDFTQRVANMTNKYMQLYTVTGGLEDWKKKKIVQILTLGQSISSGDSLTYQYNETNQAGLDERGLALQRYVDAGLPAQADQYSFADSIDLQAAVNRFYGTNKQATQDFNNAVEQSGMKDVKDEFYSVINQIYDAAEEQGKSPDYDLIEKIQARYLQMMDSALIPLINQYGINVLNNNDFIDAVRRQVNGMIPSDDWRQSAKNAKKFLSTKEFPTATVDVKKWLKSRYSSGMRDRGLDSDPEVTERIESIRNDIDAGRMGSAKGKIEDLKKGVNKANFYISSKDLMTLNDLQNMVK